MSSRTARTWRGFLEGRYQQTLLTPPFAILTDQSAGAHLCQAAGLEHGGDDEHVGGGVDHVRQRLVVLEHQPHVRAAVEVPRDALEVTLRTEGFKKSR